MVRTWRVARVLNGGGDDDGEDGRGGGGPGRGDRTPLLVRAIIVLYFGLTLQTRLLKQAETGPSRLLVSATVVIVLVFGVQLLFVLYGPRAFRPGARRAVVLLAAQAALAVLPLLVFGNDWYPVAGGFLAGAVLLLVRPPLSWLLVALIAGAEGLLRHAQGWPPDSVSFCMMATVNVGVSMYALTRLAGLIRELHLTRAQFAAAAAARERIAASGSLRAVLDAALTRIEAASRRALARGAAPSRADLDEVVRTARRALGDVRSIIGALQAAPPPAARQGVVTQPRLAWTILAIITAGFGVQQVMYVQAGADGDPWTIGAAVVVAGAVGALQLRHSGTVLRGRRPKGAAWTFAVQFALVFVPFAVLGWEWATMACLVTASALLVAPGRVAWWLFGATVAAWYAPALWASHGTLFHLYTCAVSVQIGVIVYALDRLPRLAREVAAARERLARMAALHERLRISRDVHDLLGLGLSTITVKAELARRVAGSDPARARAELAELIVLADRSRAEASAVAEDEPALVLREEADAARVALAAVGARVRMDPERWPTAPPAVDAVLAAVLREAVTNVLRHARARRCHIAVTVHKGTFRLTVGNDGAGRPGDAGLGKGSGRGLANLTARATAAGGSLSAGADGYGRFALVAEVPASAASAAARDGLLLRESLIA